MPAGKSRSVAKKLRARAQPLWAHTAKLRPYANKLRRRAVKAVDAVGTWLHRGIVRLGKVSPRTAKRLEAVEAWVNQSDARKLGAAALAAVFVLAIGFAASFPSIPLSYSRVLFASGVPLSAEARRIARSKAEELAARLDSRLDRKGKLAGEAWISAQILVALGQDDPSYAGRIDSKLIEKYFRSVAGPECVCWRRVPQGKYPNHLGVTAWVLWTFAQYGIPAHKGELEFLLSTQGADGGWPLFADARQEKFASSYATAAAILALHGQSALEPDSERKKRLAAAVQRGTDWLKSHAVAGRARWTDYPAWPGVGKEFLGISGFALFALHRAGARGLADLDRAWLRDLPVEIPDSRGGESSNRLVQAGKRSYSDDTRYHGLPWAIAATMLVYPNASIPGKVRAAQWLERALAPGASIYAPTGREKNTEIAAETLLALRSGVTRD